MTVILEQNYMEQLYRLNANELKTVARSFGVRLGAKAENFEAVKQILSDPRLARQAVEAMGPLEQTALSVAYVTSGFLSAGAVAAGVAAAGFPFADMRKRYRSLTHTIEAISRHVNRLGIWLGSNRYGDYHSLITVAHPSLFSSVQSTAVTPFRHAQATMPIQTACYRPLATVLLDLFRLVQVMAQVDGVRLTQKMTYRKPDVSKLKKAAKLPNGTVTFDENAFAQFATAIVYTLLNSDLMQVQYGVNRLRMSPSQFAELEPHSQIRMILTGVFRMEAWREAKSEPKFSGWDYVHAFRVALLMSLVALPTDSDQFYPLDAFEEELYRRIALTVSLNQPVARPESGWGWNNKSAEEREQARQQHVRERRITWEQEEAPWVRAALTTWVYYFGLVELGYTNGQVTALRLTDLGRSVLHPDLAESSGQGEVAIVSNPDEAHAPTRQWIVQPNLEIIVYLAQCKPKALTFIEQHAEPIDAQRHTATYRLTRMALYRGLEAGSQLGEVIETLEAGSGLPLPQNVRVELEGWAFLREQVVLHEAAQLVEFSTAAERDAVVDTVQGTPVGERFLLMPREQTAYFQLFSETKGVQQLDYGKKHRPRLLTVYESGRIMLQPDVYDLQVLATLDAWAEYVTERQRRLTPDSIRKGLEARRPIRELLTLLTERSNGAVPDLVKMWIENAAKAAESFKAQSMFVITAEDQLTFRVLGYSEALQRWRVKIIDGRSVAFDVNGREQIMAILRWQTND